MRVHTFKNSNIIKKGKTINEPFQLKQTNKKKIKIHKLLRVQLEILKRPSTRQQQKEFKIHTPKQNPNKNKS